MDPTLRNRTAVVGVSQTPLERRSARSIGAVAVEAALNAIADAGLTRADIDGYVGAPAAPGASALHADGVDEVSAGFMVSALGLKDASWVTDVDGMAGGMVVAAVQALATGSCRYVLALRALYNPPDRKYSESRTTLAAGPDQFTLPYGIGPGGGRFAQWLQRYMYDHGASREALFEIAVLAREHAQHNPLAIWRDAGALTLDTYMNARWINEPMCLYDSDMPVTGAAAVVMTTAERATGSPHRPAYIAGYANSANPTAVFEVSGITRRDVRVAQIYDGYAPMVWLWLERFGFCGVGEAHQFAAGDRVRLGGELPLNTFGGALGEGRLHGMGHVREAALQAMGRAGPRQVRDAGHSLVQVGIPERSWTVVFSADPG
ncbi:MAG TPA: hypothetical protein VN806_14400 [Caulobacteraceae bacterium]|nr:hypothetical protein [Caulobacteraceae bacterium]